MKKTKLIMGMPITVEVVDESVSAADIEAVFGLFGSIDTQFSTYKPDSEISQINAGLPRHRWSQEMKKIMRWCQQTKDQTYGYFDIQIEGRLDPSGLVKGWAIQKATALLHEQGFQNYYINAGGDIQTSGHNAEGKLWRVGVRNPFNKTENVKIIDISGYGIATSGTDMRGQHIYNPKTGMAANDIASITVIGADIFDADRFATAAFAMGKDGLNFIENLDGLEAYAITIDQQAAMTTGFRKFLAV